MNKLRLFSLALLVGLLCLSSLMPTLAQETSALPDGLTAITIDNAASVTELAALEGHESVVNSVAFSPDGTLVASGGDDATVRLWDTTTGEETLTFSEHTGAVHAVIFSPDGATVASTGFDLSVLLWDAATGTVDTNVGPDLTPDQVEFVHSFTSDTLSIRGLTWLDTIPMFVGDAGIITAEDTVSIRPEEPDNLSVARTAGSLNSSIVAIGMSTGLRVSGHGVSGEGNANIPVLSVAFAPNTPLLATGDARHMVKLWNVENIAALEPSAPLEGHTNDVTGVAFSPDGTLLVSSSLDGTLRLWNVETQEEIAVLSGPEGTEFRSVAFSADGTLIASAGSDGVARLWGIAGAGGSEEAQAPETTTGITIHGTIYVFPAVPMPGTATVELLDATKEIDDPDAVIETQALDSHGSFAFTNLPPGEYFVSLSWLLSQENTSVVEIDRSFDCQISLSILNDWLVFTTTDTSGQHHLHASQPQPLNLTEGTYPLNDLVVCP